MKQYYLAVNNVPVGPYTLEQLVAYPVKSTDFVWCEGMTDWAHASMLPEIAYALAQQPVTPPIIPVQPSAAYGQQPQPVPVQTEPSQRGGSQTVALPPPSSWLAWAIVATLFCCLPFGIVGIVKASKVGSLWAAGLHEEAYAAARSARNWTIAAYLVGGFWVVLYIIAVMAFGLADLINI